MTDITEEKRTIEVQHVQRRSTLKLEFEERKRILFHIHSVTGLPHSGWQPLPSTFVFVESFETKETFVTDSKKSAMTIYWHENTTTFNLKESSKIRFELRTQSLWNKAVIGTTETFDIRHLLHLQSQAGNGRNISFNVALALTPSTNNGKSSSPKAAVLTLTIREIAVKDQNTRLTSIDQRNFVEECRRQCLENLSQFDEKMIRLQRMFENTDVKALIDIILGVSEGVRKTIESPAVISAKSINQSAVQCLKALDNAFLQYQSLSARQMAKRKENTFELLQSMLCNSVQALESLERFLRRMDAYTRDKLEFKVIDWIHYFEACQTRLVGEGRSEPLPALKKSSRRVHSPHHLVANSEIPKLNMLEMTLPDSYASRTYDRGDFVRLMAKWIFTAALQETCGNGNLTSNSSYLKHSIFCLSGSAGCGKTELSSRIIGWLGQLGSLGGYFTFDSTIHRSAIAALTSSQILDALPVTLAHQICTVQPDISANFGMAFSRNPNAVYDSLEVRFEKLFVNPIRDYDTHRPTPNFNPLQPLVFIIDGIGSDMDPDTDREIDKAQQKATIQALASLLGSKAMSRLPEYIKFIVICRSECGLDRMLKESNTGFVCDIAPIIQHVEGSVHWTRLPSGSNSLRGSLSPLPYIQTPSPSPSAKGELYHPLL